MVSLFGDSDASATRRLRSEYEHRIQMAASQEERHRLARDLHDSIKQQLFAIHTAAATAQARFDGDTGGARVAVEQIRASAREAMAEMDAMLHGLRAAPLENTGMVEALKQACEALAFRTGASVEFLPGDLPPSASLPPGVTDAIFRVAQEALSNVARHARASHVRVTLERTGRQLQLVVKDDGSGFDQARAAHGSGLANMRARAAEYEGRLEVVSTPGAGTRLSLAIPVVADPDDAKYYLRRAIGFCAVGLLNVVVPILGEGHLWVTSVPLLLVMLLAGGLDLVAYSRTRRPPEVRR
jgi:signal transduction histidine kinase